MVALACHVKSLGGQAAIVLVVDLSALSISELRRLLTSARARNEPSLAADLVAELDLREGGSATPPLTSATSRWDWLFPTAGFAVGALALIGVGWALIGREPPPTESAVTPRASVALAPPTASAPSVPEQPAPTLVVAAPPLRSAEAVEPPARQNPCYDEPTPADRLVCGYPTLSAKHRRMREAYLQALAAGADPQALVADQQEWKLTRDGISDRSELGAAYAERIRDLEAAALAARTEIPG